MSLQCLKASSGSGAAPGMQCRMPGTLRHLPGLQTTSCQSCVRHAVSSHEDTTCNRMPLPAVMPSVSLTQGLPRPVQRGIQVVKHLQLIRRARQHPVQLSVGGDVGAAPQGALAVILQQGGISEWVGRTTQAAFWRACPASPFREYLQSLCKGQ